MTISNLEPRLLRPAQGRQRAERAVWMLLIPATGAALFLLGATLVILGSDRAMFLAVGGLPLVAVSLPLFVKRHRELGMYSFAIISIAAGYTIRLAYVYADNPSRELIDRFFLRGEPPSYFLLPTVVVSIGLVMMGLGYIQGSGPTIPNRHLPVRRISISNGRLYTVTGFFAIATFASFILFVGGTGGFDVNNLSSKRSSLDSLDVGSDRTLQTFGELRYLSDFGTVGYMFLLAALLSRQRRLNRTELLIVTLYLLVLLLLPFYSSNRSDALLPLVSTLVMLSRYGRTLNWRMLAGVCIGGMLVFNLMSSSRSSGTLDLETALSPSAATDFVDATSLSRSFADFSKTSHLIQRVPEDLPFRNGSTIAAFVIAPIPRSIWPSKPLISSGPVVGQVIYEQRRGTGFSTSGVPPGFFGEMYWNFGPLGILLGAPLLGYGLGRGNRWANESGDVRKQVFYAATLVTIVSGFLAVGVGFSMIQLISGWLGVQLIFVLLGRPQTITSAHASQLSPELLGNA